MYYEITLALMLLSGLAGYYLGERGFVGVKNDMIDIKNDISVIKNKIDPVAPPVV